MNLNDLKLSMWVNNYNPTKNANLKVISLVGFLNYQKELKEGQKKGTYGSIFPFCHNTFNIDNEYNNTGVLFVDLDVLKKEVSNDIFNNFETIFDNSVVCCYFSASHYLHFICFSDNVKDTEDYKRECKKAYANICLSLMKYYNVNNYYDLLDILWDEDNIKGKDKDNIFDFHSVSPSQRLFLYPSDYKINTNIESVNIDENIYNALGWNEDIKATTKKTSKTFNKEDIKREKENLKFTWKDVNNYPVFKREGNYYKFEDNIYTPNDFRYTFLNTLANIENVDFDLVQKIFTDEKNINELFSQWEYSVNNGLSKNIYLRYLYINGFIESNDNAELYNYLEDESNYENWNIIEDGNYLLNYSKDIYKELCKNQTLFIESGCGTGKTTLITNFLMNKDWNKTENIFNPFFKTNKECFDCKLYQLYRNKKDSENRERKNILGFAPLNSIISQSYKDFTLSDEEKNKYTGVGCKFTNINFIKSLYNEGKEDLRETIINNIKNSNGYIIIDEIHTLYLSSSYREVMTIFLDFLFEAKEKGVKIIAFTGTPLEDFKVDNQYLFNKTLRYCRENYNDKDIYEINIIEGGKGNYNDIVDFVSSSKDDCKYIIFNNDKRQYIGRELKNNNIFSFGDFCRNDRNYYEVVNDNPTNIILNTSYLPKDKDIIISTSFIQEGVNILDTEEDNKIVFLTDINNINNVVSLIQLGGRCRKQKSIINLFVKDMNDFNTSINKDYITTSVSNIKASSKLNRDYIKFVNSFHSLEDWINYFKLHKIPVIINKINTVSSYKILDDNVTNLKINLEKIMKEYNDNKSENQTLRDYFQVNTIGASESVNEDYLKDGFIIVPCNNKYYNKKIYFRNRKNGKAILRLLDLCQTSKILEDNEKEGINFKLLDGIHNLYNLCCDLKKWIDEKSKNAIQYKYFQLALLKPIINNEQVENLLSQYTKEQFNNTLLEYANIKIYDIETTEEITNDDIIKKVANNHKIFKAFNKYPKTIAKILLGLNTDIINSWKEIEEVYIEEYNDNIIALSTKQSLNAKNKRTAKDKDIVFVVNGVEKKYKSKSEVDKDFKIFGFKKRDWERNRKNIYNLKEGECFANITLRNNKYLIS